MRVRNALVLSILVASAAMPATTFAQGRAIDVTVAMLDKFFTAHDTEKTERASVDDQIAAIDEKITKWRACAQGFLAVGANDPSKLGFAAKMAMKAKCGATSEDGFQKEKAKLLEGPENAAASAGGFKLKDYRNLRDQLMAYMGGDQSGFTTAGLDVLKSRQSQLESALGMRMVVAQSASGGGARGIRGPSVWTQDYAWIWISQLFAIQYLSGATMFEKPYQPGQWTTWHITSGDNPDETQSTERAFIGRNADGGEWWRLKTITTTKDRNQVTADTVSLEALFKPEPGNTYVQQLVRMRAKLPGSPDAQEMMVPQQWASWNMNGAFQMRPTQESIDGATVGVEQVATGAGTFKAKHVRFGQGGGSIDWWLDDTAPGGWVKFAAVQDGEAKYTMELTGRGTGAKSELGVMTAGAPPQSAPKPAAASSAPAMRGADPSSISADAQITPARLDGLVKGLNAMNAAWVKDSVANAAASGKEQDYKQIALAASGLNERVFSLMVERMIGYFEVVENPSLESWIFTTQEQALLKQRLPTLRKAAVHVRNVW